MTVLRIANTIAADAGNALVSRNLAVQRCQDGYVPETVVGHFHGPDLERGSVDPKMHFPPLATLILAVLLPRPIAFVQHLDARAVHQYTQIRHGRDRADDHVQRPLSPADSALVRYRPVERSQAQQPSIIPTVWRSCKLKRHFMLRENWIASSLNF